MSDITTTIVFPDGVRRDLHDWHYGPMYSALCLSPWVHKPATHWRLFDYGEAQAVPEIGRPATQAHTNVPRPGFAGLPSGFEGWVTAWSAVTSMDLESPVVRAWTESAHVSFRYNGKPYLDAPLAHLFKGNDAHQSLEGVDGLITDPEEVARRYQEDRDAGRENPLPAHLREHLGYHVDIEGDPTATQRLRSELRRYRDMDPARAEALIRLDVLRGRGGGSEIEQIIGLLTDPREVGIVWIRLHGLWKRPIA